MATTNYGNVNLAYKYKYPAKGNDFSKQLRGILPDGLCEGGTCTFTGNNISLIPYKAVFNVSNDKAVTAQTNTTIDLTTTVGLGAITPAKPYVVMRYDWAEIINNYPDYFFKDVGEIVPNDIIIAKAEFDGSDNVTGFDYSETTYSLNYEGSVKAIDGNFSGDVTGDNATFSGDVTGINATFSGNIINATFSGDVTGDNAPTAINHLTRKDYVDLSIEQKFKIDSSFYRRNNFIKAKSNTERNTLVVPSYMEVNIEDDIYFNLSSFEIDINVDTYWDNADYETPEEREGKDFYIYACIPSSGNVFDIVLSANATFPTGYTAINSRKIGGFHCLCVDVGTDTYSYVNEGKDPDYLDWIYAGGSSVSVGDTLHWLYNYVAGNILPFSCWDLKHRPNSRADVEGKVYDPKSNKWIDIYLPSWNGGLQKLESKNLGTIADGTSTPIFHWYRFSQVFGNQGQNLLEQFEFVSASLGAPQGVNIAGSADPVTTTGHVATNNLRIVSNIGCEDITGVMWQWGNESGTNTATADTDAYDGNDKNVGGQEYSTITRPVFGGPWSYGVRCGSRYSRWLHSGLYLSLGSSGRGWAEPIKTIEVI